MDMKNMTSKQATFYSIALWNWMEKTGSKYKDD